MLGLKPRSEPVPQAPEKTAREQWALRDIVPMITDHFGVAGEARP